MSHVLPALLLGVCTIFGLLLVPLGLPGLWVMVAGIVGYGWLTDFRSVGVATIGVALGLAFLGEIIEWWLGFRFARTYGGSRRSAWGALVGGPSRGRASPPCCYWPPVFAASSFSCSACFASRLALASASLASFSLSPRLWSVWPMLLPLFSPSRIA